MRTVSEGFQTLGKSFRSHWQSVATQLNEVSEDKASEEL